MDQVISISASLTIVCYMMYTLSPETIEHFHNPYLYLTNIFVIVGIIRYLQILFVDENHNSPIEIILKDHLIQLCMIGWTVALALIITE